MKNNMVSDYRKTRYKVSNYKINAPIERRIVVIADLHERPLAVSQISELRPDMIAIVGDFIRGHAIERSSLQLLSALSGIAPTYYSMGNHESNYDGCVSKKQKRRIRLSGAVPLDNQIEEKNGVLIGGWSPGKYRGQHWHPNMGFMRGVARRKAVYKIMLCHNPEFIEHVWWYERTDHHSGSDLMISGHAHGGQIQLFGHGLFAPGQGVWPKYTRGVYEGKDAGCTLVVSAGLSNTAPVPRLFNKPEIVVVDLG